MKFRRFLSHSSFPLKFLIFQHNEAKHKKTLRKILRSAVGSIEKKTQCECSILIGFGSINQNKPFTLSHVNKLVSLLKQADNLWELVRFHVSFKLVFSFSSPLSACQVIPSRSVNVGYIDFRPRVDNAREWQRTQLINNKIEIRGY